MTERVSKVGIRTGIKQTAATMDIAHSRFVVVKQSGVSSAAKAAAAKVIEAEEERLQQHLLKIEAEVDEYGMQISGPGLW